MKQLRSAYVNGTFVDVIAETDDYYWVKGKDKTPFNVYKADRSWIPYTPTPEPGDVWAPSENGSHYRVIGVDEKRGLWHMCLAESWHNGEYPQPADGVQVDPATQPRVFTRTHPDTNPHWRLIERPDL